MKEEIRMMLADPEFPPLPWSAGGRDSHRSEWVEDANGQRILQTFGTFYGWAPELVAAINALPELVREDGEMQRIGQQ